MIEAKELHMSERHCFDIIDQEQLAAQLVALMDAHFQRPSATEKRAILVKAGRQIQDAQVPCRDHELVCEV